MTQQNLVYLDEDKLKDSRHIYRQERRWEGCIQDFQVGQVGKLSWNSSRKIIVVQVTIYAKITAQYITFIYKRDGSDNVFTDLNELTGYAKQESSPQCV